MNVWVFHRASLGDCVLMWPVYRAMLAGGASVTLVTDAAKAKLAAAELGLRGLDAEAQRWRALWIAGSDAEPEPGAERVLAFAPRDSVWAENARRVFRGAPIEFLDQRADRVLALELAARALASSFNPTGHVAESARTEGVFPPSGSERAQSVRASGVHRPTSLPRPAEDRAVVLHVGAGSEDKRWPMARWTELVGRLRSAGCTVCIIAGEVEAERLVDGERSMFDAMGGRYLESLTELADVLRRARLFIGADSGPSHLSAQLNVPTVCLFGPTEPRRWAPIGPDVRIIAPDEPAPMACLGVERVLMEIAPLLPRPDGGGGRVCEAGRGLRPPS